MGINTSYGLLLVELPLAGEIGDNLDFHFFNFVYSLNILKRCILFMMREKSYNYFHFQKGT